MSMLLPDYSEDQIIAAAQKVIKQYLNWDEEPTKVQVEMFGVFFVYDESIEDQVPEEVDVKGLTLLYSKGKNKRIGWIEVLRPDLLKQIVPMS